MSSTSHHITSAASCSFVAPLVWAHPQYKIKSDVIGESLTPQWRQTSETLPLAPKTSFVACHRRTSILPSISTSVSGFFASTQNTTTLSVYISSLQSFTMADNDAQVRHHPFRLYTSIFPCKSTPHTPHQDSRKRWAHVVYSTKIVSHAFNNQF